MKLNVDCRLYYYFGESCESLFVFQVIFNSGSANGSAKNINIEAFHTMFVVSMSLSH
jgi:hypothetical protein